MNINEEKLTEVVARQVADEMFSEHSIDVLIEKEVRARIDKIFADRAQVQIAAAVDDAIRAGFDREYHAVSSFGETKGTPTSIRKELERLVTVYWSERVDIKSGKPSESSYSTVSRAEWLMTKICAEDFSEKLKQAALNVTGALKDGLRGQIAQQMDSMLDGLFRVKSLQDQGKVEKPY